LSNAVRLLIATTNPGKIREIKPLLAHLPLRVASLEELGADPGFVEEGSSFAENAAAKALHYHRLHSLPAVADDSGLVIDALDGEPGVKSSRYLGDAPYASKMEAVLKRMRDLEGRDRSARFTCALALAVDGRVVSTIVKHVFGVIADAPRGDGGFGYDPIFFCTKLGKTFGEAPQSEKDRVSHRAQALRTLAALLETHAGFRELLGLDHP
jgi:XTP/dITP diphosphohydrolase